MRTGTLSISRKVLPGPDNHERVIVIDHGNGLVTYYNRNIGKEVSVPDDLLGSVRWDTE